MKSPKIGIIILALVAIAVLVGGFAGWQIRQQGAVAPQAKAEAPAASKDLLRATYDPIHFKPAIETARDEQCLACHREVLDDKVRETSPAGVKASTSKACIMKARKRQSGRARALRKGSLRSGP